MPGNKPFTLSEYIEYNNERKRLNKAHSTHANTFKVRYKALCPACLYNAENGKKIILNCPHCKIRYWNNCSPRQVRSGEITRKLQIQDPTLEWVMAYDPSGSKVYEWHRHEANYEQDYNGRWVPKTK